MDRPITPQRLGEGINAYSETWYNERAIPERDDAIPLCIYCCTEPQQEHCAPYCSIICGIAAQQDR